jgi:urate oxidase
MKMTEKFGQTLGRHFLTQYGHIDTVTIMMEQNQWERQIDPVVYHITGPIILYTW